MSSADDIWNRAVDGEGDGVGDKMLGAVLLLDGMIQNGGMANALDDLLEEGEILAGVAGFRYFGLNVVADLVLEIYQAISDGANVEELEATRDGEYYEICDADAITAVFRKKLAEDPTAFSPL
ncbi:hypothetical protein [Arcanobacterium hippocoleae]|uniref:Uncharacterized protein n=1 Tax=Arcanobacterium hippocoleae TaxID=149017 RepID=A0ABU1SZY9_9ACTO|nr:hypothetical protein [Arcanobacterium hippocoleae]MDR6938694.1 hypothetical protein [Arcanobacterium hippocoleae]